MSLKFSGYEGELKNLKKQQVSDHIFKEKIIK